MERPKRVWSDDIRQWTGLGLTETSRRTEDRMRWKTYVQTWVHDDDDDDDDEAVVTCVNRVFNTYIREPDVITDT